MEGLLRAWKDGGQIREQCNGLRERGCQVLKKDCGVWDIFVRVLELSHTMHSNAVFVLVAAILATVAFAGSGPIIHGLPGSTPGAVMPSEAADPSTSSNSLTPMNVRRRRLFASAIAGLMPGVNAFSNIVGAVQGILNLFGSHSHEALVGTFQNQGYSDYFQDTEVFVKVGLPTNMFNAYMKGVKGQMPGLLELIDVPPQYKRGVEHMIKYALYTDSDVWNQQSATFSIGNGGQARNFQLFTYKDDACDKFTIIIVNVKSSFKLGNDIFVVSKGRATLGGAFSTTKLTFQEKPASISVSDVDFVSRYFTAMAMKRISESIEVANFKSVPTCRGIAPQPATLPPTQRSCPRGRVRDPRGKCVKDKKRGSKKKGKRRPLAKKKGKRRPRALYVDFYDDDEEDVLGWNPGVATGYARIPYYRRLQSIPMNVPRRRLFASAIGGLMPGVNAVSNIVGAVQGILNLFGSQTSETLVGAFRNQGFSTYDSNTELFVRIGMPTKYFEAYMKTLMWQIIKVPRKYTNAIKHLVTYGQIVDDNTWQQQSATFSIGDGGKAKNFQVFTSRDTRCGKMNIIVLNTMSTFELGDDTFVISKSKATFGGAFSKTKLSFVEKPAALRLADVEFVSHYFTAMAMKEVSQAEEVANVKNKPTCNSQLDMDDDEGDGLGYAVPSSDYQSQYYTYYYTPYNYRRLQWMRKDVPRRRVYAVPSSDYQSQYYTTYYYTPYNYRRLQWMRKDVPRRRATFVGGHQLGSIGPAWLRGEIEKPLGEKNMGTWIALMYTPEQQERLNVDAEGNARASGRLLRAFE